MRLHQLLAPRRLGPPNGDPAHAGTITTTRPDEMWGVDATRLYTEHDGWCWFFGAIDHCVDELVGWHAIRQQRACDGEFRKSRDHRQALPRKSAEEGVHG